MKKKYVYLVILSLTGCSSLNQPLLENKTDINNKPSASASVEPKPVVSQSVKPEPVVSQSGNPVIVNGNKDIVTQQSGTNVQVPVSPVPTITPGASQSAIPSVKPSSVPSTSTGTYIDATTPPDMTPRPRYDINRPVEPEGVRDGIIDIVFKDDAKVRYYGDKKILISKAGIDISNINKLVKEYNAMLSGIDMTLVESEQQTEEKYDKRDKESELLMGYEQPNTLSLYTLYVNDVNIKELVEQIRKEPTVLSSNYSGRGMTPD